MLNILFRDEWIIAVDKPAGQLVHPADEPKPSDEVTMKILRDQIGEPVETIHRLDRPTTGILLFGLCKEASKILRQSFEDQEVSKRYRALVHGTPSKTEWSSQEPLSKDDDAPLKSALTDFTVVEQWSNFALIEARPKTGRFHQIRRHLLHCDHPIVGDYRYAGVERCELSAKELGIGTRMLLQASKIIFAHPMTGDRITIEAPNDPIFEQARSSFV